MTPADSRWYESFFDDDWLALALEREGRADAEAAFLAEQLRLESGARVLDAPCGHGRHSLELARRGYRVTGVDLSEASLGVARRGAADERLDVEFVRADLRELPWVDEFDGAFNVFTSFGYFETEEEDERALAALTRSLHRGRRLLLDTVNPLALAARLRRRDWQTLQDGRVLLMDLEYDARTGRNEQTWTVVRPDGTRSVGSFSVRLYTFPELERMARRVGLDVVDAFGGLDGTPFSRESWRLVLVGEARHAVAA